MITLKKNKGHYFNEHFMNKILDVDYISLVPDQVEALYPYVKDLCLIELKKTIEKKK